MPPDGDHRDVEHQLRDHVEYCYQEARRRVYDVLEPGQTPAPWQQAILDRLELAELALTVHRRARNG